MNRRGADLLTVTAGDGSTFAIVPAYTRVRWTEASARSVVMDALADPAARDVLVRVATEFGAPSGTDDDEVLRCLVRTLVDGALVAFEEPPPPPRGLPVVGVRERLRPPAALHRRPGDARPGDSRPRPAGPPRRLRP